MVVEYEINASYNGYSSSLKVNFPWILVVFHNLEAYLNWMVVGESIRHVGDHFGLVGLF